MPAILQPRLHHAEALFQLLVTEELFFGEVVRGGGAEEEGLEASEEGEWLVGRGGGGEEAVGGVGAPVGVGWEEEVGD